MVKLLNKKNISTLSNILYAFLQIQSSITDKIEINPPKTNCIYAMWHTNQFCLCVIPNRKDVNVMVSNSIDGELITRVIEHMGFGVVRGSSQRKGCVSSMMQLITKIKNGECAAIMVDGPRGPLHKVKGGVITLAKETGVPIIPTYWYSNERTFLHLPSWDKMTTPLFTCHVMNIYGDPIYVNENDDKNEIAKKIADALNDLEKRAPEEYLKAKKQNLWKKQKRKKV